MILAVALLLLEAACSPLGRSSSSPGTAGHFGTLPPGASLLSGARCAALVRSGRYPEIKRMNAQSNQTTGNPPSSSIFSPSDDPRALSTLGPRVDGAFTGTTQEILRWAACKWGIDEDIVYAQAAKESWWRQTALGDWASAAGSCPSDHGPGKDGRNGQCPQSLGILQDRYPYLRSAWPQMERSTAMNADVAYAIWRACYEGYEPWLNTVDRGASYAAGDVWGCVGRWSDGRWHLADGGQYAAAVKSYEDRRVWEEASFVEA